MKNKPVKENHHGANVWTNKEMDELRKTECLCMNCDRLGSCKPAKELYAVCRLEEIALAVTRCPMWVDNHG